MRNLSQQYYLNIFVDYAKLTKFFRVPLFLCGMNDTKFFIHANCLKNGYYNLTKNCRFYICILQLQRIWEMQYIVTQKEVKVQAFSNQKSLLTT